MQYVNESFFFFFIASLTYETLLLFSFNNVFFLFTLITGHNFFLH